jgi:hypothetical protein
MQGINVFDINYEAVEVDYDESLITPDNMIKSIHNIGFRAGLDPFERKTLKERFREMHEKGDKYKIELDGLKYILYVFLILTGLEFIAYYGFLRSIPYFIENYAWWLFYLNVTVVTFGAAVYHFLSYKGKITCMVGMMIGMTFGMQAGMMLGAVVGATSGFFVGSMVGMLTGVIVGAYTGKSCGVMGVMQGMMAGIMGGTMGPMIVLMMFSDNLLYFMPFYMIINIMILAGFSYMMIEEVAEGENTEKTPIDFWTFASACIIVAFVMIVLMILGPKSVLIRA